MMATGFLIMRLAPWLFPLRQQPFFGQVFQTGLNQVQHERSYRLAFNHGGQLDAEM